MIRLLDIRDLTNTPSPSRSRVLKIFRSFSWSAAIGVENELRKEATSRLSRRHTFLTFPCLSRGPCFAHLGCKQHHSLALSLAEKYQKLTVDYQKLQLEHQQLLDNFKLLQDLIMRTTTWNFRGHFTFCWVLTWSSTRLLNLEEFHLPNGPLRNGFFCLPWGEDSLKVFFVMHPLFAAWNSG